MGYHIKPVIFIATFMVFMVAVVSSTGIDNFVAEEDLEEFDITEEDLQIRPDFPEPQELEVDLQEDALEFENVRFDDIDDVEDPDFLTDQVVRIQDPEEDAYIIYAIPSNAEVLETSVTRWGFFESSGVNLDTYITGDVEGDPITSESLKGSQSFDIEESENIVRFELNQEDSRIYDLGFQDAEELGLFGTILGWFNSTVTFMSSLLSLATGLPPVLSYLGIIFTIVLSTVALIIAFW